MTELSNTNKVDTTIAEAESVQQRLGAILETVRDAIITVDSDGDVVTWNPAATKIFGYAIDEIIGKSITTVVSLRFHEDYRNGMNRLGTAGIPHVTGKTVEVDGVRKDGSEIPLELTVSTWSVEEGRFFTAIIHDITNRKETEQFRRAMIESSPVGIYIVQNGKFVFVNEQFQKYIGYEGEKLLDEAPIQYVHPDDREMVLSNAKQMLKGGHSNPYEFRIITGDGRVRWVMETVTSIQYGGKRAALGNFMDISEHKQAEEELVMKAQLLDAANDSIFVRDLDGNIIYLNEAAGKMLGRNRDDLIGTNIRDLVTPENAVLVDQRIQEVLQKGEITFESAVISKDKKVRMVEVHARIIESEGNKLILDVSRDVTKRKKAEEERERSIRELQTALAEVKTLSGLLPICAWCKNLRDESGYWESVENFINKRTLADFSHSICPDCEAKYFPKNGAVIDT